MPRERLIGLHEIAARLGGISRQRTHQLTRRTDFPEPYANLFQGQIWRVEDVEAWMRIHRPDQNDFTPQKAEQTR
jgi:prophage regulatory protein